MDNAQTPIVAAECQPFEGTWRYESMILEGQELPAKVVKLRFPQLCHDEPLTVVL